MDEGCLAEGVQDDGREVYVKGKFVQICSEPEADPAVATRVEVFCIF